MVGTTERKTFIVAITATGSSGINAAYADVWSTATATGFGYHDNLGCKAVSATTATCSLSFAMNPGRYGLENAQAGAWQTGSSLTAPHLRGHHDDGLRESHRRLRRHQVAG